MNVLYSGQYVQRFKKIVSLLGPEISSVCELCFGDTFVAHWCRSRDIQWTGIDLNQGLCRRAAKLGFRVIEGDVLSLNLPTADVFVMAGSLYHFHTNLSPFMDSILSRTSRLILSEPVKNLSSAPGLIGWWAKRSANPGTGHASFRYNKESLLAAIAEQQERKGFHYRVVSSDRDLLLEIQR